MDYNRILKEILNIGREMLRAGADVSRVEDSMYRMCKSYGFTHADIWVIYSNIQATVETAEGDIITQIRHIASTSSNFDKLDYLNNLSRRVCRQTPSPDEVANMLQEVLDRTPQPAYLEYLAGILGGTGFGVFFNCGVKDAIIAAISSIIIVFLGRRLAKTENNPLISNFIQSFIAEVFIILSVYVGFAEKSGNITVGVVMLLVSALGFTNGISDLLHKDTLAGILNISNAIIGAAGIAFGIVSAILLFKGVL